MSYNTKYNTRHSGRYNTPGQFVPGGERAACRQLPAGGRGAGAPQTPTTNNTTYSPQQQRNSFGPQQQQQQASFTPTPGRNSNLQSLPVQSTDVEMKSEPSSEQSVPSSAGDAPARPYWMKSKLAGVKKVSNKERRRRQNEQLRRLLSPKNALMALNEMFPNQQVQNQFKVEPSSFSPYSNNAKLQNFCADLTIDGHTYKGYGENKIVARNAAAEQALRDLIIKKLARAAETAAAAAPPAPAAPAPALPGTNPPAPEGDDNDEEALPMIQLASFALHKLFSEWEYEGHKVPQLRPPATATAPNSESEAESTTTPRRAAAAPSAKKPKELPVNAAALHPCMLLAYMRPHLEYRELAAEGDRPQNMVFTLGVDVDGATYIGKATNKKEARKQAARAACQALFGVQFHAVPSANAPQPPPAPLPPQPAA